MIPVILSGGSGTRLWPLSRSQSPKQFIALKSELTLFQETVKRFAVCDASAPIVVCNEEHRFIVAENLREIDVRAQAILLEPVGRNTAPAIAAAAIVALQADPEAVLMILPADHAIEDLEAFGAAVKTAQSFAQEGKIVTFGIKPTHAHTGFGYIQVGDALRDNGFVLGMFKEKPDVKTAQDYVESGKYFWNSGMFCFRADVYLKELEKYEPALFAAAKSATDVRTQDLDFQRLPKEEFAQCKDISVDYAVMEHTDLGVVVSLDARWSDIGSWDAVWEISPKDAQNNVVKGDVYAHDSRNNLIHAGGGKLVTTLGVDDLIIIDTQDALMVAHKDKVQDVKKIVDHLKAKERSEPIHHRTVYRPWGHYDSICRGERDQVKRITVKPGAKLSLQKHHHRSEHWVVVKGTARVTKGDEQILLAENESVYLPLGVVHALENPGKIPLQIIEVQTGSYLGEDDIIRFEDKYGRA